MLVLSRKRSERILIGENIVVTVVEIRGEKVRLGVSAPPDIPIHREEVQDAIDREIAGGGSDAGKDSTGVSGDGDHPPTAGGEFSAPGEGSGSGGGDGPGDPGAT